MSDSDSLETAIPPELVPMRFRLARARTSKVLTGLIVIWVILVAVGAYVYNSLGVELALPTREGIAMVVELIGIGGDALAVAVLVLSIIVKLYSKQSYLANYRDRARRLPAYSNVGNIPNEMLDVILSDFHGVLKSTTSEVLKSDVGATLLAVGTFLTIIGDLVKG